MNLEKMFEMQRALDDHINKTHPVQEAEDRLAKKVMAFIVEVSELANEWRGFKFWSTDQKPRTREYLTNYTEQDSVLGPGAVWKNPLLEEYVDGLHFLLSIGLEQGRTSVKLFTRPTQVNIVECFLDIYTSAVGMGIYAFALEMDTQRAHIDYDILFNDYLSLGDVLGFTETQIEQAYFAKNKVNHERQDNGY